jgi:hypothetical protein
MRQAIAMMLPIHSNSFEPVAKPPRQQLRVELRACPESHEATTLRSINRVIAT